MTAQVLVWALLGLAVALVLTCSVRLLVAGDDYARLHLMAPVTSVAGPLVGLAIAVRNGFGLATATALLTVALLVLAGAAVQGAMGRLVAAHRDGQRR
ncbi:hypothetical protein GCM10023321_08640 [Pseudonocardia eucalypti]|uniref:Uncharacterized protein n=1 Tax=Pseudonocardia eucalypti TaxID=648755 RepID=A0ABP9PJH9_9PSEU|nr:multicomponent Na+:H+ antiporter subunit G [Pseudonocardia eucalypti]